MAGQYLLFLKWVELELYVKQRINMFKLNKYRFLNMVTNSDINIS